MPDSQPNNTRDAEATRARLLQAATESFAGQGYAGVRVDQIAAEAGVNKAMIYHYFGNKQGLYRAVIDSAAAPISAPLKLAALRPWQAELQEQLSEAQLRLMAWEGLCPQADTDSGNEVESGSSNERLNQEQQDTEDLALLFVAATALPQLCPQLVAQVTGLQAADEDFQQRWSRFQRRLLQTIEAANRTRTQGRKERIVLRGAASPSGGDESAGAS